MIRELKLIGLATIALAYFLTWWYFLALAVVDFSMTRIATFFAWWLALILIGVGVFAKNIAGGKYD